MDNVSPQRKKKTHVSCLFFLRSVVGIEAKNESVCSWPIEVYSDSDLLLLLCQNDSLVNTNASV